MAHLWESNLLAGAGGYRTSRKSDSLHQVVRHGNGHKTMLPAPTLSSHPQAAPSVSNFRAHPSTLLRQLLNRHLRSSTLRLSPRPPRPLLPPVHNSAFVAPG